MRDYVLVHQDKYVVEVRSREAFESGWQFAFYEELGEGIQLPSLGVAMKMGELYHGLKLGE